MSNREPQMGTQDLVGCPREGKRLVEFFSSGRTHSHSAYFPLLPLRTTKEQIEKRGQKSLGRPDGTGFRRSRLSQSSFYRSRRGHGKVQGCWMLVAARSLDGSYSSVPPRALPRAAPGRVPRLCPCCLPGAQNRERAQTLLWGYRPSQTAAICGRHILEVPWKASACVHQAVLR